jgi:hypothetical protein
MRQTIKGIGQYEVSIVVFYGRDLYCPTADELNSGVETPKERSVYARIGGGGLRRRRCLLDEPESRLARVAEEQLDHAERSRGRL